jgi:hypothetical protein
LEMETRQKFALSIQIKNLVSWYFIVFLSVQKQVQFHMHTLEKHCQINVQYLQGCCRCS